MRNFSKFYDILKAIMVLNRDDGKKFTDTRRLEVIGKFLLDTPYRRIDSSKLFHLYSKKPLEELPDKLIVVSSHIDCHHKITKCFVKEKNDSCLLGTFDNALTNAAILYLMMEGVLNSNVVVAFTGDEEEDSKGAHKVAKFFRKAGKQITVVVLDVTDMGWKEECDFTVENNFWDEETGDGVADSASDLVSQSQDLQCQLPLGERVIDTISSLEATWRFVPSYLDDLPTYVPSELVIPKEADEDESWEYDENDIPCFSLCIPIKGKMHSNDGALVRKKSIARYVEALEKILAGLS